MSIKSRLKKSRTHLSKRINQQIQNKDAGRSFPSILDKSKLPEGIEIYKINEGKHLVDIIPWECGPDMPFEDGTMSPITNEGDFDYVLDLKVHRNVGAMREQFVCPYYNFGEPCPICEYTGSHFLEKDTWKELAPKRRVFYLVWGHMTRDQEKKGLQLMEVAHFHMEAELNELAEKPRGGGAEVFYDPFDGKQVAWRRKGTGMNNTQYLGYKFVDRDYEIPEGILEQGFSIDQVVKMHPSYEEIEKAFKGQAEKLDAGANAESVDDAGSNFDGEGTGDMPDEWDDDAPTVRKKKTTTRTSPGTSSKSGTVRRKKRRLRKK